MRKRFKLSRKVSRRKFRNSAKKTNRRNMPRTIMRGGYRL